jgi:hypothetical protein
MLKCSKNLFKKSTICLLLIGVVGTMCNLNTTPAFADDVTRAVVVHSVGVPGYGEEDTYYYVQPNEADQIANNLAYSTQQTFAQYIICLFGKTVPQAAILGGITWSFQTYNSTETGKIKDLAVNGPVAIKVEHSPYGTYISSEQWDSSSDSINLSESDSYDSTGRHYFDTVTYQEIE